MATRVDELTAQHQADLAARCPALADYNPLEPAHLADPYPLWNLAQREAPVFYIPAIGCWAVTGYELLLEIVRDTATFTSIHSLNLNPVPAELAARLPYGWPEGYPSLINSDPPAHTAIRRLAQSALTRGEVARREPEVRALARQLIDSFSDAGGCDIMARFAVPLPVAVIARILGAADEESGNFGQWGEDAFMMSNPTLSAAEILERGTRLADLKDYLEREIARRRNEPRDDLLTRLVQARVEGEPMLSDEQIVSVAGQLLVGGNETTTHMIANSLLLLLGPFMDTWRRLQREPNIIPAVVEEMLRIKSSIRGLFRTTTREVEIGGVRLPEGATIWMLFAAANHDESIFACPAKFNPDRENLVRHIAFGRGVHQCIGAPLARLEMTVALEELSQRLPTLRLAAPQTLTWHPSLFTQGVTALHVEW
jgi:cytochrome P450